jgi:hypothetical protein
MAVVGLSFLGAPPPERHAVATRGCEEGDSGILRRVVQAAEVTDPTGVGDKGRRGGSKGQCTGGVRRCTEQSPDNISAAQAALASGVATGSGGGGLAGSVGRGVGGPTVCSFSEPLLCAPSSHCGELFWATSGVLDGVGRRSTVGWSFAGRLGNAFGGGVACDTSATSASLQLGCEALRGDGDVPHCGGGSVGHGPLWTTTW